MLSGEELGWLWRHPQERQDRHLALREAATLFLTGNAASTEDFAIPRITSALRGSAAFQKTPVLLDAGCGPGYYLDRLSQDPGLPLKMAVGLDRNRAALVQAQARLKNFTPGQLVQGDILKLPFGPAAF